ncbi:hypothetical protein [Georgenia subflava]|uniref:hypothetical protein n=1 Tax=Georgenia subflava TaxID=1622177 RepID=UPI00186AF29C|nr:hypothetical protein [Georgenia subflava]
MSDAPDQPTWPFPYHPSLFDETDLDELATGHVVDTITDDEEPLAPINWNTLTAEQAQVAWLDLNSWVNWLRRAYGLSPKLIPPMWHRHDELVWELSALHTHWLACYDPEASPSAPTAWHRDFADARHRLREWVASSGTGISSDRPTRQSAWPGENPLPPSPAQDVVDRDADFVRFIEEDILARRDARRRAEANVADLRRHQRGGEP